MTNPPDVHVVLGATGGAGAAIVRDLLQRGRAVRAVTREGKLPLDADAAEWVAADARNASQLRAVCRDAAVIYHAVNVPYPAWPDVLPSVMDAALAAAESSGARLVYVDNLYMYGPVGLPLREDLPAAAQTRKGRLRAKLAARLLSAHQEGRIRATIGRCSDFYGPGVTSAVSETVFRAVLAGKTARWFGSLDQPHSLSFIDDAATAFVTLGEDERSLGEVWHLPVAEPVTGRMFIALAGEVAGTHSRPAALPAWAIRLAGLAHPLAREMGELTYQFARPFVVDDRKYRRAFGSGSTPYREALARTLAWYRAQAW
jgi:nucleoside-diphosphate-sugar epimerase